MANINFSVNGKQVTLDIDPKTPILWALRDHLNLTGTKFGCGIAQCGACTIHLNGVPTRACMTPVSTVGRMKVTTIEGLAKGETLHPLQNAFWEKHGLQCGFC
ncbi:MAG TPA: (2Fe-2S)-binding protein, partial [Cytophagales bacterium]|nr:(2Fe-2S)-binding protein [Cytophagales bacterium]